MTRLSHIIILALGFSVAHGQTCTHTGLSKTFNFYSSIKRIREYKSFDSCIVTIRVKNKTTKKIIQTVHFTTKFLFDSSYVNCNNVRSYTTGKNKNAFVGDNDYGDMIVADFNFDNREDFAIKRGEGGNGGPNYDYYIQTSDTTFKLDKFLSDKMIYFPSHFDKNKKTLTTLVHASAVGMGETTFKLDTSTNKWGNVGHRLISYKEK